MSGDDGLREAIARWLWAMDAIPGAVWDEWPDEHAEYLSKADDYAADLPWLAALRAKADAADRVRELLPELDAELDEYGYALRNGLKPSPADRIRAALAGPPC